MALWSATEQLMLELVNRARLDPLDRIAPHAPTRSDRDLNPDWTDLPAPLRPAAVLAPIVRRPEGWTMLFTQRAEETPAHPGQVSFPGGRVHADDASPLETALRETEEEIGLRREYIEIIGMLPDHVVITGYRVTPVVGLVRPGFALTLNPTEVAGTFEARFGPIVRSLPPEIRA